MSFKLPDLPYPFDALEPHIDARTMEIHHGKHHAGYTNNLNAALEKAESLQGKPIEEILADLTSVPETIVTAVRNNGGGYANHTLFWKIMGPGQGREPQGNLASAIINSFGDFASFKETFSKTAATRFGSGWAWLAVTASGDLKVYSTANQDSPFMEGMKPVLGLDVWEHAYYLNYQNRRPDYIAAWWNVVNWTEVEAQFEAVMG
jgi:Fe-Mn family superoxide dismutase